MKKILVFALAAMMVLGLCACGESGTEEQTKAPVEEVTEAPTEVPTEAPTAPKQLNVEIVEDYIMPHYEFNRVERVIVFKNTNDVAISVESDSTALDQDGNRVGESEFDIAGGVAPGAEAALYEYYQLPEDFEGEIVDFDTELNLRKLADNERPIYVDKLTFEIGPDVFTDVTGEYKSDENFEWMEARFVAVLFKDGTAISAGFGDGGIDDGQLYGTFIFNSASFDDMKIYVSGYGIVE